MSVLEAMATATMSLVVLAAIAIPIFFAGVKMYRDDKPKYMGGLLVFYIWLAFFLIALGD